MKDGTAEERGQKDIKTTDEMHTDYPQHSGGAGFDKNDFPLFEDFESEDAYRDLFDPKFIRNKKAILLHAFYRLTHNHIDLGEDIGAELLSATPSVAMLASGYAQDGSVSPLLAAAIGVSISVTGAVYVLKNKNYQKMISLRDAWNDAAGLQRGHLTKTLQTSQIKADRSPLPIKFLARLTDEAVLAEILTEKIKARLSLLKTIGRFDETDTVSEEKALRSLHDMPINISDIEQAISNGLYQEDDLIDHALDSAFKKLDAKLTPKERRSMAELKQDFLNGTLKHQAIDATKHAAFFTGRVAKSGYDIAKALHDVALWLAEATRQIPNLPAAATKTSRTPYLIIAGAAAAEAGFMALHGLEASHNFHHLADSAQHYGALSAKTAQDALMLGLGVYSMLLAANPLRTLSKNFAEQAAMRSGKRYQPLKDKMTNMKQLSAQYGRAAATSLYLRFAQPKLVDDAVFKMGKEANDVGIHSSKDTISTLEAA